MLYDRLRYIREKEEYTQTDIANKLGLTKSCYCRYENETDLIPLKHLINICDIFNISLDYVFSFTEKLNYKNSKKGCNYITSGIRLKEFRKENKLTQDKLAEKLNVARTIISKYEKGNFLISLHSLYTISNKYNISTDYLLGKIDNPKYLNK